MVRSSLSVPLPNWISLFSLGASVLLLTACLQAQTPPPKLAEQAQNLVTRALKSEAAGELVDRDRMLSEAARLYSDFAPARWLSGWFKDAAGSWQSAEEQITNPDKAHNLSAYENRRSMSQPTAQGQYELARWCAINAYPDQARAHLMQVIELDKNHIAARTMLGFRRVGDQWIDPQQIAVAEQRAARNVRGLTKHRRILSEIAHDFRAHKAEVRQSARDRLLEIEDLDVVAAVESMLGSINRDSATASVEWLTALPDPETTMSLVRFAMLHPIVDVRRLAIEELRDRPYYDYVPQLLDMLASPVAALSIPVTNDDGVLIGFRQAFGQERLGQLDVLVIDTTMRYSDQGLQAQRDTLSNRARGIGRVESLPPTDPLSRIEANERATAASMANAAQAQSENERLAQLNQSVARLMTEVTDREFSGDPTELWKWWDSVNETEKQSLKLPNIKYQSEELATRNYIAEAQRLALASTQLSHECLARGTEVLTRKGLRAIETLRVGDLVLSRDVRTGELTWKAVLRATTRPPRPVLEITVDKEKFRATGGHLFWVSGQGWVKASQLKPGDVLHAAAQPVVVMKIKQLPEEQTYNLAVDQTQTYFVGKQLVLSHDVTDRAATHITVPGLSP